MLRTVLVVLSMCVGLMLTGCHSNKNSTGTSTTSSNGNATAPAATGPSLLTQLSPALTTLDRAAVSELTLKGLQGLAKKKPTTINATVTALKASLEGDIIPYLQGQAPLQSGNSVASIVNSKLLSKLPADVKLGIQGTVDTAVSLLNAPAASSVINAADLGYLVAAIQGIDDACNAYLSSLPTPKTKTP